MPLITKCSIPDRWMGKWFGGKYKRIDVLFSTVVLSFLIIDIVASIKEIYFLHFQTQSQCGLDEIGACCQCNFLLPNSFLSNSFWILSLLSYLIENEDRYLFNHPIALGWVWSVFSTFCMMDMPTVCEMTSYTTLCVNNTVSRVTVSGPIEVAVC